MKRHDHAISETISDYFVAYDKQIRGQGFSEEDMHLMKEIFILYNLMMSFWHSKDWRSYYSIHTILNRRENKYGEYMINKMKEIHDRLNNPLA